MCGVRDQPFPQLLGAAAAPLSLLVTFCCRDTTLLPNIHGLPALTCLLFAPIVEMRCVCTDTVCSTAYSACALYGAYVSVCVKVSAHATVSTYASSPSSHLPSHPPTLPLSLSLPLSPHLFRMDSMFSRYTGALCGLGCDPATGESLYSLHDLEISFDTAITQQDLDRVSP